MMEVAQIVSAGMFLVVHGLFACAVLFDSEPGQ